MPIKYAKKKKNCHQGILQEGHPGILGKHVINVDLSVGFKLLTRTLDGEVKEVAGNAILSLGESKKFEVIHMESQISKEDSL